MVEFDDNGHSRDERPRRRLRLLAGSLGIAASAGLALAAGIIGAWYFVAPGLPAADTIRQIPLQIPLRVYSRDGRLIEEVGERRRILVAYDELEPFVVQAFVAAEDSRFFSHPGVDPIGIARAAVSYLRSGSRGQGGSTITQQLARDYFLTRERLFTRKLREAFLAWKIEQEFSKEEIMELFLNKMFFGQRAYGVAAAAQVYFGKPLENINVAEAATLAGVLPAPSNYNPVRSPANARIRRTYVLGRMLDLDYIDEQQYEEAMAEPVMSRLHGTATELSAPWVAEMVRREMLERYGEDSYSDGYRVVTTLDSRTQRGANHALRNGLLAFARRRGYRGPVGRVELPPETLAQPFTDWPEDAQAALEGYSSPAALQVAVVAAVDEEANSAEAVLQDGSRLTLPWHGISWARPFVDESTRGPAPESVADVLTPGDIVHVMRIEAGGYALAQAPQAQGAVVSLDPQDGAITSLAGGYDFSISKFNRVTQAYRQPGSSFKPFIYSAALEQGNTPATVILDAPVVIESSELEAVWRPLNYTGRFYGEQRMREALVRSMNLASVRLLLNNTGVGNALRHLEPFGFSPTTLIRNGSLALGGGDATPLDMAQAYAVFANGGFAVEPYVIDAIYGPEGEELYRAEPAVVCNECRPSEPEGDVADENDEPVAMAVAGEQPAPAELLDENPAERDLERMATVAETWRPTADEAPGLFDEVRLAPRVISPQNAWLIQDMMRDVIRRGTGRRARVLGRSDLSGKTGTSNDRRDAWFAGFNYDYVGIVWIGYDDYRPLGAGEEGSRTALPVWIDFTRSALDGAPTNAMPMPNGIVSQRISKSTGCPADSSVPIEDTMFETFRAGNVPQCEQGQSQDDIFNQDEDYSFDGYDRGPAQDLPQAPRDEELDPDDDEEEPVDPNDMF